jgi:hypothetical protein
MTHHTMENRKAQSLIEELGHIYAVALAERGHNIDIFTPICNGLAAYFMLKLEGEFDYLDEAVDVICRIVYEGVREQLQKQGV